MDLQEIKAYLETNKDNEDVKNYLVGLSKVTPEGLEGYIATDEGKKWLGKKNDSFFSKGLETWKQNNLQKLIDDGVAKANPEETPEQKQIRELTERLNKKEAEEKRQSLLNKGLLVADEKKLPKDLIEYFLGEDEEATNKNLETLEKVFTDRVNKVAAERLEGGYKPPKGGGSTGDSIQEQFRNSLEGNV